MAKAAGKPCLLAPPSKVELIETFVEEVDGYIEDSAEALIMDPVEI